MEPKNSWKEAFNQSKPLITYALISGLDIKTIAKVFNHIKNGGDPSEMHIEQTVLDRIPKLDRPDYDFPATAPVFLEGYNIMKEPQNPKAFPIVLTSTEAGRRYGIALMFYEDLRDHVKVMQEAAPFYFDMDFDEDDKEDYEYDKQGNPNFDRMLMEDRNRQGTITEDERESVAMNTFQLIHRYIMKFTPQDLARDDVFNGENYYIPKAIILISELPIFETLEQIIRHIYRQCITGIDYPIESYLSYLTHAAPLPPIGFSISYSFPNLEKFTIENKLLNELPAVPVSFYFEFFTKAILNLDNFFDLMYWFMCQLGTTVCISTNVNKIVMSTEVLRTIIFPFEYDDTYIPCLPSGLINYLEAPFPVLVGIVVNDEEQLQEIYDIASNKTMFVHLDDDELKIKLSDSILTMKEYKRSYETTETGEKIHFSRKELPLKKK